MAVPASSPAAMGEPSATGRFGSFGGRFVPESLVGACKELEACSVEQDRSGMALLEESNTTSVGTPAIVAPTNITAKNRRNCSMFRFFGDQGCAYR